MIDESVEHRGAAFGLTHGCHIQDSNVRSSRVVPILPYDRLDRTYLRPSLTLAILALTWSACGPAAGDPPEPARCGPAVPATAQHPLVTTPGELAGDYELILVQSQPAGGSVIQGHLHLSPLDSATRAAGAGGPVRDLIGWLDPASGDSSWRSLVASRDAGRPGVVLAGQHLWLGRSNYPDRMAHHLTITAIAPEGFWGWWKANSGFAVTADPGSRRVLPDPAGYFCALRRPS